MTDDFYCANCGKYRKVSALALTRRNGTKVCTLCRDKSVRHLTEHKRNDLRNRARYADGTTARFFAKNGIT